MNARTLFHDIKPATVEAMRYDGRNADDIRDWLRIWKVEGIEAGRPGHGLTQILPDDLDRGLSRGEWIVVTMRGDATVYGDREFQKRFRLGQAPHK